MPSNGKVGTYIIRFTNCHILRQHKIVKDDLWVRDGKFLDPNKLFFEEKGWSDVIVDCFGATISPGYIDLQINGGFGIDFSLDTENVEVGLQKVSKGLLSHGVTSFCPTIVTSPKEIYNKVLPHVQKTEGSENGAGILGVHLEGPFINSEKRGAHPEEHLTRYDNGFSDVLSTYSTLNNIRIVTIAPELLKSVEVTQELVKRGIVVSVGHSMASLAEGEVVVKAGASFITHLFNAMLPFHHRDPHLVGLLTSDQRPPSGEIYFGMIADGAHSHPAALRIAHKVHSEGLILVTDAVPGLGLEPGFHTLGQLKVEITNVAKIAGTDTLCGSIAPMNVCVKNFYEATECSKADALESATLRPAKLLGITEQKGTLDHGTDADFILLDDNLNLLATFISGKKVWEIKTGTTTHSKCS
ncbi:N-acetylglucosamine-6-phosphate deacetylase-like isoform X2 [Tubulanus polymorphus]|uniref:N-acetylglucosamine-6-phosphate deacetylase-like isoform X2 n=1 Tax=Tubulanus polymorphus TaxID=672921 RepID=UPI003DA58A1D